MAITNPPFMWAINHSRLPWDPLHCYLVHSDPAFPPGIQGSVRRAPRRSAVQQLTWPMMTFNKVAVSHVFRPCPRTWIFEIQFKVLVVAQVRKARRLTDTGQDWRGNVQESTNWFQSRLESGVAVPFSLMFPAVCRFPFLSCRIWSEFEQEERSKGLETLGRGETIGSPMWSALIFFRNLQRCIF